MALIPETELFAETVDFNAIDITEPVLGGLSPEGPINRIARILGSRTLWLRAQLLIVQLQGLRFKSIFKITNTYQVLLADASKVIIAEVTASGKIVTLPNSNNSSLAFTNGLTITIKNKSVIYDIAIQVNPSATSYVFDNGTTNFSLKRGDTVTLAYDGANKWYVVYRTRTKDRVGFTYFSAGTTAYDGYFLADGSAKSRLTYLALFQEIGTTYGSGDGVSTFNIPDLRGEFIRGLDNGRGIDSARALGSTQSDMLKAHTHDVENINNAASGTAANTPLAGGVSGDQTTKSTGGAETRPRNIALNGFIYHGVI